MLISAYAAGPDVFFPNAREHGERKRQIAAEAGIELLLPLDNDIDLQAPDAAMRIYEANRDMMRQADICIANISPFRGPSADDGTAFELGFFDGLGKPAFAYSNTPEPLVERTQHFLKAWPDPGDLVVEDFGLPTNLMLPGAVRRTTGSAIFLPEQPLPFDALDVFAEAVQKISALCAPIATIKTTWMREGFDRRAIDGVLHEPNAHFLWQTALPALIETKDPSLIAFVLAPRVASRHMGLRNLDAMMKIREPTLLHADNPDDE